MKSFVLKGQICTSVSMDEIGITENGYLVVEDGLVRGVFRELPGQFAALPLNDRGSCLILPGMTDLHVHAPQFAFRGLGMDMELLELPCPRATTCGPISKTCKPTVPCDC